MTGRRSGAGTGLLFLILAAPPRAYPIIRYGVADVAIAGFSVLRVEKKVVRQCNAILIQSEGITYAGPHTAAHLNARATFDGQSLATFCGFPKHTRNWK